MWVGTENAYVMRRLGLSLCSDDTLADRMNRNIHSPPFTGHCSTALRLIISPDLALHEDRGTSDEHPETIFPVDGSLELHSVSSSCLPRSNAYLFGEYLQPD